MLKLRWRRPRSFQLTLNSRSDARAADLPIAAIRVDTTEVASSRIAALHASRSERLLLVKNAAAQLYKQAGQLPAAVPNPVAAIGETSLTTAYSPKRTKDGLQTGRSASARIA
jgi:hypothetical protein